MFKKIIRMIYYLYFVFGDKIFTNIIRIRIRIISICIRLEDKLRMILVFA